MPALNTYAVTGKTAATAATIDNAVAALWNPSTAVSMFVSEIHLFKLTAGAADEPKIRRISARGTATVSATPTIVNDYDHNLAPASGALLDLTYSAQPTFLGTSGTGGDLVSAIWPAAIGVGMMWSYPVQFRVKPGQGLCIATGIALAFPASRVTFVWEE